MTLETFFEKFDLFADAPDAVAKIRELIIELAIRGNLVPHNASEEPASALLRQMETLSNVQAGKVRKQATLPPVGDDAYLPIPPGWEWTRLGNTGGIFNGNSVSESGKAELAKVEDGLPFVATKDVGYGRDTLVYDNGLKVPLGDPRFKVARAKAVLICAEGGSAGRKIGITDRDICFGNKLYANEVWEGIHHRYIFYVYQAPTFFREFAARMTGIIGGIARSEFLSLPIPLPPEQEQKRIVAKVDELMALCDRLDAQQQERETRHAALARASLARFADAATPNNLNFLFNPSYTIPPSDLRKSILRLAVQGKVVPQDPNDGETQTVSMEGLVGRKNLKNGLSLSPIDGASDFVCLPLSAMKGSTIDCSFGKPIAITADRAAPYLVKPRDIFIIRGNGSKERVGISGMVRSSPPNVLFPDLFIRVPLPPDKIDGDYFLIAWNSPVVREMLESLATTTSGIWKVNQGHISECEIPLPPLAEQRRIVDKVEQLMALVDKLETQLAASRTTATNLLSALVAELTGIPSNNKVSASPTSSTGRRGRPRKS